MHCLKLSTVASTLAALSAFTVCATSLPDAAGNEYDLSDLSKESEPWVAIDTSKNAKKRTFYLNVCKPLPFVLGCPGKPNGQHFLTLSSCVRPSMQSFFKKIT